MDKPNPLSEAAHDPVVKALLAHLTKRQNNAKSVTAELIKGLKREDGIEIRRHDAIKSMRLLEQAGVGRFLTGRRGRQTRLELAISARDLIDLVNTNGSVPSDSQPASNGAEKFEFRFPLRHDFEVCLELPVNWDADARQRLSNAILALPTK